jgi:hypothetical protein
MASAINGSALMSISAVNQPDFQRLPQRQSGPRQKTYRHPRHQRSDHLAGRDPPASQLECRRQPDGRGNYGRCRAQGCWLFPPTTPEQVFGSLRHQGKPKTLREMLAGVAAEACRRHARGRY